MGAELLGFSCFGRLRVPPEGDISTPGRHCDLINPMCGCHSPIWGVWVVSSAELGAKKNTNIEVAKEVGKKLAEKAAASGISEVVFDRNGYIYHGKVKALADGAREGGLKF